LFHTFPRFHISIYNRMILKYKQFESSKPIEEIFFLIFDCMVDLIDDYDADNIKHIEYDPFPISSKVKYISLRDWWGEVLQQYMEIKNVSTLTDGGDESVLDTLTYNEISEQLIHIQITWSFDMDNVSHEDRIESSFEMLRVLISRSEKMSGYKCLNIHGLKLTNFAYSLMDQSITELVFYK